MITKAPQRRPQYIPEKFIETYEQKALEGPFGSVFQRPFYTENISWHLPTPKLIDLLVSHSPILSIGCGLAYTESLAKEKGCDIIATDLAIKDNSYTTGEPFMEVEELGASKAIKKYGKDRTIFLAWPPYKQKMCERVLKKMSSGQKIIYVGEWKGCTGTEEFHDTLKRQFELLEEFDILQWDGINDYIMLYQKKRT